MPNLEEKGNPRFNGVGLSFFKRKRCFYPTHLRTASHTTFDSTLCWDTMWKGKKKRKQIATACFSFRAGHLAYLLMKLALCVPAHVICTIPIIHHEKVCWNQRKKNQHVPRDKVYRLHYTSVECGPFIEHWSRHIISREIRVKYNDARSIWREDDSTTSMFWYRLRHRPNQSWKQNQSSGYFDGRKLSRIQWSDNFLLGKVITSLIVIHVQRDAHSTCE